MVFLAALVGSAQVAAQTYSPDDPARRAIERRAVDAVIWGMPAVNTDLMRREMNANAKVYPEGRGSEKEPNDG